MSTPEIETVRSADGTEIAYERAGQGPAVVFVDGAFCTRTMGPGKTLRPELSGRFTTFVYDRRGRGASGDTDRYEPQREVEDLAAVIEAAGGSALVFGHSSGAVLALEAARAGLPIDGLVLYEPPLVVDDSRPPVPPDFPDRIARLAAAGRPRTVVRTFMTEAIRAPKALCVLMSVMPGAGRLAKLAHTIAYDAVIMNRYQRGTPPPEALFSSLRVPTLIVVGGKSPKWICSGGEARAAVLPTAQVTRLEGQSHRVKAAATAPVVEAFFTNDAAAPNEGAKR